jgi:hypothetical protein
MEVGGRDNFLEEYLGFPGIDEHELFDDLMDLARERASEAGAEELIPFNHVSMQPKQQFTQQCSSARKYGFLRIL